MKTKTKAEVDAWFRQVQFDQLREYKVREEEKRVSKFKIFVHDQFIEPISDYGLFTALVVMILKLGTAILIMGTTLWLIDSCFLKQNYGQGVIVNKYYKSEYTYYTSIHAGNTSTMIPNTIPESFNIVVEIEGLEDKVGISETNYNELKIGDTVECAFKRGRIFKTIYIND